MMMNTRKPHFLEIFLPNLSADRLEVPSKFIKHLGRRTSGVLSLTGPSGNSWHVDLIEHDGHLFFDDGWPTFVKDHSIECGDSLVFRYDGNSCFSVQIFDQSSCEKEEAFYAECSEGPTDSAGDVRTKRGREREDFTLDVVGGKKRRCILTPVHLEAPTGQQEKKLDMCTNELDYVNRMGECIDTSKKSIVLGLPCIANTEWKGTVVKSCKKKKSVNGTKTSKKIKEANTQVNISISKFIESRAAHYFSSSFPYFVRVMNYSNISGNGTMKIPIRFSEVHFPNCRTKVTLRNLNGDCWLINSVATAKKRSTMHTFCGGWLAFVRENGIKIEDVCIFELVDKFELLVRILRLGVEGLDSQALNSDIKVRGRNSDVDGCGIGSSCCPLEVHESVPQNTSTDLFLKDSEELNELYFYDHEEHTGNREIVLATHHEAASFIDHNNEMHNIPLTDLSLLSRGCEERSDELVLSAEGTVSWKTGRENEVDLQIRYAAFEPRAAEEATGALSFTSPFPNFMKVIMNSNVGGSFTLAVPRKFSAVHLPSHKTEIILRNLKGDSWNVVLSRYGHQAKLCGGWMSFVRKNDVKVGDVCVFELVDEKVLQVRIFGANQKGLQCNDVAADDSTVSVDCT